MDKQLLTKKLFAERPNFHGRTTIPQNWQLPDDVLEWLDMHVQPGQRTLETGCGYSTVLFALKEARHTVISPAVEEHERIRGWCEANEIDVSNLDFKLARSEEFLPVTEPEPLDLVLIDGWHAFPAPIVDWFFTPKNLWLTNTSSSMTHILKQCGSCATFLKWNGVGGNWWRASNARTFFKR
jgi:hypothetical protein